MFLFLSLCICLVSTKSAHAKLLSEGYYYTSTAKTCFAIIDEDKTNFNKYKSQDKRINVVNRYCCNK